jgi:hydroxyethylthiazole kinase-like uncharacterized protein yjeF
MHPERARHHPEPLPTPAEMGEADRAAPGLGTPGLVLMHNAGAAVARVARGFGACRTLVLCGPGGNGGDGWVAARLLAQQGWPVAVAEWGTVRAGSDAAAMRAAWHGPVVPFAAAEAARASLVIDAVFGAGFHGDLPDAVAAVLAAAPRVLAVDVPSGVDGATGQAGKGVRAPDATVTFVARKPGHLMLPGRTLCGPVTLADILMPADAMPRVATWRNTPALWAVPQPGATSHKYTRGDVTVLGGAQMTGAARLAAGAARRGGAGIVTLAAPGAAVATYRTGAPGLIVSDTPVPALLQDARRQTWVCGPGLSQDAARAALPLLLAAGRQVVADADALGAAAGEPERLCGCTVITPHAGEFAKVFGHIGSDKLEAARAAARRIGCVVLLKGADTVIAAPDGRAAINDHAPPWLATAGSGDVLAGLVGALLAQGMPAWEAACAAAWLHGDAGFRAGQGLIAEDLLPQLTVAINGVVGHSLSHEPRV